MHSLLLRQTLYLILTTLLFVAGMVFFVRPVGAVDCTVPISGNVIISSSCTFPGSVNGSENGNISVTSGTLTIGAGQTIVFNSGYSFNIPKAPAALVRFTGSVIKKTNLWMIDADSDGYPDSTTQYGQDAAPAGGRRRATMLTLSNSDCDTAAATKWRIGSFYVDSDGDGYGTGSSTPVCYGGSTPAGYSTNSTDCDPSVGTKWQNLSCYVDSDGDGWTSSGLVSVCKGTACNNPAGHSATSAGTDCNDSNASLTNNCCAANYGQACSSCNSCGSCNNGTYLCDGVTCSVGPPPYPYGSSCTICNSNCPSHCVIGTQNQCTGTGCTGNVSCGGVFVWGCQSNNIYYNNGNCYSNSCGCTVNLGARWGSSCTYGVSPDYQDGCSF